MENLDCPALIEEWKQNLDATDYGNSLYKDVNLSSIERKIYRNDKTEYWPTSINQSLDWLPFFDIMEFTEDRI